MDKVLKCSLESRLQYNFQKICDFYGGDGNGSQCVVHVMSMQKICGLASIKCSWNEVSYCSQCLIWCCVLQQQFCKYNCLLDRLSCSENCNPWHCCPMSSCWQYCTWTWLPGHLHISQGPVFALLPGQQTLFTVDFTARGAHPVPPLNREMY